MAVDDAVKITLQLARALECAHGHGIVHRDLKPANIFVTASEVVKVLDFGIAKALSDVFGETFEQQKLSFQLTERTNKRSAGEKGPIVGTLPYMAPEQWGTGAIDHRVDLWAVGIILYEMVVGQHPLAPLTYAKLFAIADVTTQLVDPRASE